MEENFEINGEISYSKDKSVSPIAEDSIKMEQLIDFINNNVEEKIENVEEKVEEKEDDRDLSEYKVIGINDNLPMHPCVLMVSVVKKDDKEGNVENIGIPGFLEPVNSKFYILDSNWKEIEVDGFDESLKSYVSNFHREVVLDETND